MAFVAAVVAMGSFAEQLDHWVYESGTISDGVWTFNATLAKDKVSLTVADSTTRDSGEWEITALDFSKPVLDANQGELIITAINTKYSTYDSSSPYYRAKPYPESGRVGAVTLPTTGLTSISDYAFGACTNLTLVGGFPASLKTIGSYAFPSTKISGDLVFPNLTSIGIAALAGTKITSCWFGKSLTTFNTSYGRGTVQSCKLLTNIVFEAGSSISSLGEFSMQHCAALTSLDLSAFQSIVSSKTDNAPLYDCLALERIILGSGMTSISASGLYTGYGSQGSGSLTQVRFRGLPPQTIGTPFLSGQPTTRVIATIVELDPNSTEYDYDEALAAWGALTAGGEINESDSTWSEAYAGSSFANRPLLLASPQTVSVEKGNDLDISYEFRSSFTFSRAEGDSVGAPRQVNFKVGGTAVAGVDYKALPTRVTIPAGERSLTVPVEAIYRPDSVGAHTITVTITPWDDYSIDIGTATITLTRSKDFDGWTYDPAAKTITRGDWTFNVTSVAKDGYSMSVGKWVDVPESVQPLDFSGLVVSAEGSYYEIVSITPQFAWNDNNKDYRTAGYDPQASRVGQLTLPSGLKTIGDWSFGCCSNLGAEVEFPASLTSIGISAFCRTPLAGDLVLTNLTSLSQAAFASTKITSCRFGPGFRSLGNNYARGAFQSCKAITNIIFDVNSSVGRIGNWTFNGCSALEELDIRVVEKFEDPTKTANAPFNGCSSLKRITLGAVECVYPYVLAGVSSLESVVFVDVPPVGAFTNYLTGVSASRTVTTYVPKKLLDVTNAVGVCWRDLATNGEIRRKNTTWKSDYLVKDVDPAKRPLLQLEPDGLILLVR